MPTLKDVPELTEASRETLASELETVQKGLKEKGDPTDLSGIISKVRDLSYPTDMIVYTLAAAKLKWFAQKVVTNYYNDHTQSATTNPSNVN